MSNTVLLIENDESTVIKAKEVLEGSGYSIVSVDDAQTGVSKASELVPTMMLINLATPGANGLELCKSIHNTEGLESVPIILLTLREGKFEPIYTKLYGIVAFLKKPFEDPELLELVQEHAPVTEVLEEEPLGFDSDIDIDAEEEDTDDSSVFSLDDTEESLDDLQASFQQPLDEEAGAAPSEDDEFEGTQQFSLDDDAGAEDTGATDDSWGETDTGAEDASWDAGAEDTGAADDSAVVGEPRRCGRRPLG